MKLYDELLKDIEKQKLIKIAVYPTRSNVIKRYESWIDSYGNQYLVEVLVNDSSIIYKEFIWE